MVLHAIFLASIIFTSLLIIRFQISICTMGKSTINHQYTPPVRCFLFRLFVFNMWLTAPIENT